MIELGCCAFCFRGWSVEKAFPVISGMGFRHVSVGMNSVNAQVNPLKVAANPKAEARRVREQAEAWGLRLTELFVCPLTVAPGLSIEPNDPDAALRKWMLDRFRTVCDFAAEAGFHNIMSVPGNPQAKLDAETAWRLSVESLTEMTESARRAGVILTVEPHRWSILQTPEDTLRFFDEVPGLQATVDYAHFTGKGVPEAELYPLHERAAHVHARPACDGSFSSSFEANTIDFRAIVRDLRRRGWEGVISMERFGDPAAARLSDHPAILNAKMADLVDQALKETEG
jgi:sugar phosphate isomerase/epimerase